MEIKPFVGPDGHTYSKAEMTLSASPIFKESEIQFAVVLIITPYRKDEEGKIIPGHDFASREVIPDIRLATKEQQLVIANIEAALGSYLLNKSNNNG